MEIHEIKIPTEYLKLTFFFFNLKTTISNVYEHVHNHQTAISCAHDFKWFHSIKKAEAMYTTVVKMEEWTEYHHHGAKKQHLLILDVYTVVDLLHNIFVTK